MEIMAISAANIMVSDPSGTPSLLKVGLRGISTVEKGWTGVGPGSNQARGGRGGDDSGSLETLTVPTVTTNKDEKTLARNDIYRLHSFNREAREGARVTPPSARPPACEKKGREMLGITAALAVAITVAPHVFFQSREGVNWLPSELVGITGQMREGRNGSRGRSTAPVVSSRAIVSAIARLQCTKPLIETDKSEDQKALASEPPSQNPNQTSDAPTTPSPPQRTTWSAEAAFSEPSPSPHAAPATIFTTFSTDLNILKIHEAVRARFALLFYTVPEEREEAEATIRKAQSSSIRMAVVERVSMIEKAKSELGRLDRIESREMWREYCDAARPFLEAYAPVASDEARGAVTIGDSALCQETESPTPGGATEECVRSAAIRGYLEVAKQYIDIRAFQNVNNTAQCPVCGASEGAVETTSQTGHSALICACGRESIAVAKTATFQDSTRIDTGVKNTYEDLANFMKRIDAFEGKQRSQLTVPLLTRLLDQLEAYFADNPLPCGKTCAEIRAQKLGPNGKKEGTSIKLLGDALLHTENAAFYREAELIAHRLWGWELADLTSNGLRRILKEDYIATQKVYEEHKERESSLNVNLRLYYHLRARGYPCELSDFKIVSSLDSLKYHDRMLRIMSEKCGLPIIPLLPQKTITNSSA